MPELPEVETVRRGLACVLVGKRIDHVRLFRKDLRFPLPMLEQLLHERIVSGLTRKGKLLCIGLDNGAHWLVHLGMTGRFWIDRPGRAGLSGQPDRPDRPSVGLPPELLRSGQAPTRAHEHMHLTLEDGVLISYEDARRFGYMDWALPGCLAAHARLQVLGPDPFEASFTLDYLADQAFSRLVTIKSLLLDQSVVAGIGNIYASEILFMARLHPERRAGLVTRAELSRLHRAILATLSEAIEAGGVTIRDFVAPNGEAGRYSSIARVYGRVGAPCSRPRCRGSIERSVLAGRASFYCPGCQR